MCTISHLLCPTLCDPMDCSHLAPLSMGFSRQEYWSGLPFPPPRDLLDPGIKAGSLALQAESLPLSHQGSCPPYSKTKGSDHVIHLPFAQHGVRVATGAVVFRGDGRASRLSSRCLPAVSATCGPSRLFKSMTHQGPTCCLCQSSRVNQLKSHSLATRCLREAAFSLWNRP